jgi:hypothetical protein
MSIQSSLLIGLANISLPDFTGPIPEKAFMIGDDLFVFNEWLEHFNAPYANAVESNAFWNCQNLISVNIPEAKSIGDDAFSFCYGLTSANFPNVITIGEAAFAECSFLASVDFPKAITIGEMAFFWCYENLTSVYFPEAKTIEEHAFQGCEVLVSVDLPKAETIVRYAFLYCYSLAYVHVPNAYFFGNQVFYNVPDNLILRINSPASSVTFAYNAFEIYPGTNDNSSTDKIILYLGTGVKPERPNSGNTWNGCTWKEIHNYEDYVQP